MAQQKTAGMYGEVAGKILDLSHQGSEMAQGRVLRVQPGLGDEGVAPAFMGHQLGQPVQAGC